MEPEGKIDEKYVKFLDWFKKNGGLIANELTFPQIFEPGSYLGVGVNAPIKKNKVVAAIPHNLIISLSRVRQSPLKGILDKHAMFHDEEDADMEFNVLVLFLIHQWMKKQKSFFWPYLNAVSPSDTLLNWSKEEIAQLKDPYVSVYMEDLSREYHPLYEKFSKVMKDNPKLFPESITYENFLNFYSRVTTRCFGWGIPQTMIVPMADFLNHSQDSVAHYLMKLPFEKEKQKHKDYILKHKYLDLELFGIPSHEYKKYELDSRGQAIKKYMPSLKDEEIIGNEKELIEQIHKKYLTEDISTPLLLSEDEEDDDSEQEQSLMTEQNYVELRQKEQPKQEILEKRYQQPRLPIDRQFTQEINWGWWKFDSPDAYFIISTRREMKQGEQLYNSYGKRSNRYLLTWYGFTIDNNKYDSVPFRLWMWKGQRATKHSLVFSRCVRDDEWENGIELHGQLFPTDMLTRQFRLKDSGICKQLVVYLRLHLLSNNTYFKEKYVKQNQLKINFPSDLQFELDVFQLMLKIVQEVSKYFVAEVNEQPKEPRELFAYRLKMSNKNILDTQQKLIQSAIQIIKELINKQPLKEILRKYDYGQQVRLVEYLRTLQPLIS